MKKKEYKEKYSKKVKKKKVSNKKLIDYKWVGIITICAFFISILFSFLSELIIDNVGIIISLILLIVVIFIGILFDMIGISVTVADIKTFNSMASRNVKGAKLAVKFIKNADKLSSFCNDVIGDICGIISGALCSSIALMLASNFSFENFITTLIITGFVAALTIGGKAFGKSFAINKSNIILYNFSRFISFFNLSS
ncbi:MAG: hypothetical protein PUD59_03570 [bacterium]|nr:hypothetical protein [bacterium]